MERSRKEAWRFPLLFSAWCVLLTASTPAAIFLGAPEPASGLPGDRVSVPASGLERGRTYSARLSGLEFTPELVAADAVVIRIPDGAQSGTLSISGDGETGSTPLPLLVLRRVPGSVEALPGLGPSVVAGTFDDLAGTSPGGSFTATVVGGGTDLVWAFDDTHPASLLAVVTDSTDHVRVGAESTAVASVVQGLRAVYGGQFDVDELIGRLSADERVQGLATKVAESIARGQDYADDPGFADTVFEIASDYPPPPPPAASVGGPFIGNDVPGVELRTLNTDRNELAGITFAPEVAAKPGAPDAFVLRNATRRGYTNGLDWTMELFRVSAAQFPDGFVSMKALEGHEVVTPRANSPIQRGFQRAESGFAKLDLLANIVQAAGEKIFGSEDAPADANAFTIPKGVDGIYLLQSYSGNIYNRLGVQAGLIDEADPNEQWAIALAGNIVISAIDVVNAGLGATKALSVGTRDLVLDLSANLSKTIGVYRERGDLDAAAFVEIFEAAVASVAKTLIKAGLVEGSLGGRAARLLGAMARTIDIAGRISSAGLALHRFTASTGPLTLAVERTLVVVGSPFQPAIGDVLPAEVLGGERLRVQGTNFSRDEDELIVELCAFAPDPDEDGEPVLVASVEIDDFQSSPTEIGFFLPDGPTLIGAFPGRRFHVCVTKDEFRAVSDELAIPPPPTVAGILPEIVTVGSVLEVSGENFGESPVVRIEGNEVRVLSASATSLTLLMPGEFAPPLGGDAAEFALTVSRGSEESDPVLFEVVQPLLDEDGRPPLGANIPVTELSLSLAEDDRISVLEAFLVASGGLGRALTTAEADRLTSRDFQRPQAVAGAGFDDVITFAGFNRQAMVLDRALPAVTGSDSLHLEGVILDGSALPEGTPGIVFEQANGNVFKGGFDLGFPGAQAFGELRNFPGPALVLGAGSGFAVLDYITVVGGRADGLVLEEGCHDNLIRTLDVTGVSGHGLRLAGADRNSFRNLSIREVGGDGIRCEAGSSGNRFFEAGGGVISISDAAGAGIRFTGAGTRQNRVQSDFEGIFTLPPNPYFELTGTVERAGQYGIAIEDGAGMNVVSPRRVSHCGSGGVFLGSGAEGNLIGRLYRLGVVDPNFKLSLVIDNQGPGVVLDGAVGNTLAALNVAGNAGDGIQLDGSSGNRILTVWTGFLDADGPSPRTAHANQGNGIRIANGSTSNEIGPLFRSGPAAQAFGSPIRSTQLAFRNVIANEMGDGIRIEAGSIGNQVWATDIGPQFNHDYLGGTSGNGISIRSASRDNSIGDTDFPNQVFVDGAALAGVLIEGAGTSDNEIAGVSIGAYPNPPASLRCGNGVVVRDGARGNFIGDYSPVSNGYEFVAALSSNVSVANVREAGLVVSQAGGSIGPGGERLGPNVFENVLVSAAATGLLVENDARVNDFDGLVVRRCEEAGLVCSEIDVTGPGEQNRFAGCLFDLTPTGPVGGPVDLGAGPPPRSGIVVGASCSGVVIGEPDAGPNIVRNATAAIYLDGGRDNTIRGFEVESTNSDATAGLVARGVFSNRISGGRFRGFPTAVAVMGGESNTVERTDIADCGVGILLHDTRDNLVGGIEQGSRNLIAGSSVAGVLLEGAGASGNRIQHNFVMDGGGDGIQFRDGASRNLVGGDGIAGAAGVLELVPPQSFVRTAPNSINHNAGFGILVRDETCLGNTFLGNWIYGNGAKAIGGPADGRLVPAPAGRFDGEAVGGRFTDLGAVPPGSRVQVYLSYGQDADALFGEAIVGIDGRWKTDVLLPEIPDGFVITATVTRATDGTTSEFGMVSAGTIDDSVPTFEDFLEMVFPGIDDPAIVDPGADPDLDGLSNFLEWVLVGDPALADAGRLGLTVGGDSSDTVVLTYRRRAGLPVDVFVAVSEDLGAWNRTSPLIVDTRIRDNGDGTERVEVELDRKGAAFARIEVR